MMYPLSIFCWTQQFEEAQELVEELYSVPDGQLNPVLEQVAPLGQVKQPDCPPDG
jgi:hypothetical protein